MRDKTIRDPRRGIFGFRFSISDCLGLHERSAATADSFQSPGPVGANRKSQISHLDLAAALLLLSLSLFHFRAVLGAGDQVLSHPSGDTRAGFYHWRDMAAKAIRQGVVPLWNPYIFCGMPFVGNVQTAVFYPPNALFLMWATPAAINGCIVIHNFLAGLLLYAFVRSLSAGRAAALGSAAVFMFSAPHVLRVLPGHLDALCTLAWLPLLFLAVERWSATGSTAFVWLGGVAAGLQILAGQMQHFFYGGVAVALYLVFRARLAERVRAVARWMAGFGMMIALGVLAASVQFLPALELARFSARRQLSQEFCASFSLPPENLVTLLLPTFFGDMLAAPYWGKCYFWEMTIYVGVLPLALALAAVRSRAAFPFVGLAVAATLLALGKHTPLFPLLYHHVPGFNLFRGMAKFSVEAMFALAVLTGLGLERWFGQPKANAKTARTVAILLLAGCTLSLLATAAAAALGGGQSALWRGLVLRSWTLGERYTPALDVFSPEFLDRSFECARDGALGLALLLAASAAVLLNSARTRPPGPRQALAQALAVALILLDLFWFGARYVTTFDAARVGLDPRVAQRILADAPHGRVTGKGLLNDGVVRGVGMMGGYDPNPPARYNELINASEGRPLDHPNTVMEIGTRSKATEMLGLKYVILPTRDAPAEGIAPVGAFDGVTLYEVPSSAPRAFAVQRFRQVNGREAILREVLSDGFDPQAEAIVEEAPGVALTGSEARRPVSIAAYTLNRVELSAARGPAALAVLSDTAYPGWRAYVDGVQRKGLTANYAVRAVALPPEAARVEFLYVPQSFKLGLAASLAAALGLTCFAAFKAWRILRGG